ncbi:hypothetical protein EUZ85_19525 [Hahella sp. KA22]|uniref:hypothetical protein n=1 Tax=Hahella sp. KA22 TaxID=1628392 RepID=UPI000FDE61CC|nr:hypothetical protein [Hahella sp. KA22]AZZ92795.1 hypothetical protein ENC22_16945 [Hahella sp. KA22]QAY56169.1 hypothetical protein EUZ85_19525 [Hahella sp. KA22]
MRIPLVLSTLALLGVAFILFLYQYLFGAETTLLNVSYASMTKSRVHLLIEGERKWYALGDSKTIERPGFLLDYDLDSKALTLFELKPDDYFFDQAKIMADDMLVAHFKLTKVPHSPLYGACVFRTVQLDSATYTWSPKQRCKAQTGNTSATESENNGGGKTNEAPDMPLPSLLSNQKTDRISPSLFFKKPETAGDAYQILDANGQVIAERKSLSDEDKTQIMPVGKLFHFDPNEPLSQMPASFRSRGLGLLPSGEVLLAFEFNWAAENSIVLIAWGLQTNTTRLENRIFYESLFSPTQFEARQLDWWGQFKYFVSPERRPMVPLHAIPATTR